MNEADFLDQLDVPIAGMVKDYIPHFLSQYKADAAVEDLGAIVQPNMERIHALHPDLILMTPLHAANYQELSEIAPTLHFDVNFNNSQQHIASVKSHLLTLGRIFDKEALAEQKATQLDARVKEVQDFTKTAQKKHWLSYTIMGLLAILGCNHAMVLSLMTWVSSLRVRL